MKHVLRSILEELILGTDSVTIYDRLRGYYAFVNVHRHVKTSTGSLEA
jgi:hypothetical protein